MAQGRGCGLHLERVAAAGPGAEDHVPGCDAGEVQPPALCGVTSQQTSCDLQFGAGEGAVDGGGRDKDVELPEVWQVVTQPDSQQQHQDQRLSNTVLDKKDWTRNELHECNELGKSLHQSPNLVPSKQQVHTCDLCRKSLMCNLDFTPNAYLVRRRFECDCHGNLFLYWKLETPPSGANPRGRHQCRRALSCDEGFPAAQGASSEKPHECTKCGKALSCRSDLGTSRGPRGGEILCVQ
nr:oncomodulin-1 isoform X1 [Pongo pygmaeus]